MSTVDLARPFAVGDSALGVKVSPSKYLPKTTLVERSQVWERPLPWLPGQQRAWLCTVWEEEAPLVLEVNGILYAHPDVIDQVILPAVGAGVVNG